MKNQTAVKVDSKRSKIAKLAAAKAWRTMRTSAWKKAHQQAA
jgi:hypothetical protein